MNPTHPTTQRLTRPLAGLLPVCLLPVCLLVGGWAGSARAQDTSVFDASGNLLEMPFEPDLPVTRSTVRRDGDDTLFIAVSSEAYDNVVSHYQEHYRRQTNLAPGWRIAGYGFDVGAGVFMFSLVFAEQVYRLEISPDAGGDGTQIAVRSHGHALGYQPRLPSVAPYRPADADPMPFSLTDSGLE